MWMRLSAGLVIAGIMSAGTANAQFNKSKIVDLRSEQAKDYRAPVKYGSNHVIHAQYSRAEDLSVEELEALLEGANRRSDTQHPTPQRHITPVKPQRYVQTKPGYTHSHDHMSPSERARHIEYYHSHSAASAPAHPVTPTVSPKVVNAQYSDRYQIASNRSHMVTKGETLYSISRRYEISIPALQRMNGLNGTTISIGQVLTVPGAGVTPHRAIPGGSPVVSFASSDTRIATNGRTVRRVTRPVDEMPVLLSSSARSDAVWAVLPNDTLYRIAQRTCMPVDSLVSANGIDRATALKPGQRLTIPAGHCLQN